MKIPKRFKLFGKTIEVKWNPSLKFESNCIGEARFRSNEIILQPSTEAWPRPKEELEHAFWHEVLHHALKALSEDELGDNEKFVDNLSALIHQAITSFEYEGE